MKKIIIFLLIITFQSCDFKYEKEFKTKIEYKGELDTNIWKVYQRDNIKFISNESWLKREASGILFTAFFDSTRKDIYTIVKVNRKRYSAHEYIKLIIKYYNEHKKAKIIDYEILQYEKKNSRVIQFMIEYEFDDELKSSYELLYEKDDYLYTLGLILRNESERKFTEMNLDKNQLFTMLTTKISVDNELIIKNNETLKDIKILKLEDLN